MLLSLQLVGCQLQAPFFVLLAINPTFSAKSVVSPEVRPAGTTTLFTYSWRGPMKYRLLLWASHRGLAHVAAWPSRGGRQWLWFGMKQHSVQPTLSHNSVKWAQTLKDKWHVLETNNEHYVPSKMKEVRDIATHFHIWLSQSVNFS